MITIQVLAFSALPYIAWLLPNAPDRGYGISKLLGAFAFAATTWLISLAGLNTDNNNILLYATFFVLVFTGVRGYRSGWFQLSELRVLLNRYAISVEGIFIGLTALFGLIRFFNPEVFWGEKPMDSTFLNFFVRNNTLPPQDPWAAGSGMSYYYLGIYFIAALLKLTSIPAAIGYNLAMATLAGWIGAALFTLILTLTKHKRFSLWAVWLLVLASNPEVLRLSLLNLFQGKQFNFDTTFWPSTRVFTSPSFLEYTSWSLLFADLHAHVIAIPFTVVALALASCLAIDGRSRYSPNGAALRLLLGAVVGALFGLNTWDFISYGGVVGILIVCAKVPNFWRPPTDSDGAPILGEVVLVKLFSRGVAILWDLSLFGASTALVVYLYRLGVNFNPGGGWGWVSSHEFNSIDKLFRVIGYYLTGSFIAALALGVLRLKGRDKPSVPELLIAGALLVAAFIPGLMSQSRGLIFQPWATFIFCGVLAALAFISLFRLNNSSSEELRVLGIFTIAVAQLIVILEIFFLLDRMNTLFKGYMAVWMLSGVATAVGLFYAYQTAISHSISPRLTRWALRSGYLFVALLILGTSINVFAVLRMQRVPKRSFTLDGIAFLRSSNPDDAAAIDWINRNVKGTPVMLEAQGDGYREFTRISMHTGVPVVLGWEHHARQRGLSHDSAMDRRKAILTIYTGDDLELIKQLLLRYRVDLIVVGAVERNTYRRLDRLKFDNNPGIFTKVFESGGTAIYKSYFSRLKFAEQELSSK
jgi:YYY domain-containing protein